ncbi:MAG: ATP-binding cassette domain-containing protein, partial [Candidatus Diapherotrites archaeon]|nr:ATP-binding cassette domain-containing protein [Candidatus Diapherotrites archaeon]
QRAIGASNRSNPATYLGVFSIIRQEFAKETGESLSLFSFNAEGACQYCNGSGFNKIEMQFLGEIEITCDTCKGTRYQEKVLKHKYQGKNIAEVLQMTIKQAWDFFDNTEIKRRLQILDDVGLGYLTLGQPLHTLSGGEAQRIKLASELHKRGNIYILDEPTTGLHMADIEKLLNVLNTLVDSGNSVIVIEHNLDVIANADWIIDLGPEGGKKGGKVITEGTPEQVSKVKDSYTGQYLKKLFKSR